MSIQPFWAPTQAKSEQLRPARETFRLGPIPDEATTTHRARLLEMCRSKVELPAPLDDQRPTVVVAAAASDLDSPGSVTAQLLRTILADRPAMRVFLLLTGRGIPGGARWLLPAATSTFHVSDRRSCASSGRRHWSFITVAKSTRHFPQCAMLDWRSAWATTYRRRLPLCHRVH